MKPHHLLAACEQMPSGHSVLPQWTHVHSSCTPGVTTFILIPAGDLVKSKVNISEAWQNGNPTCTNSNESWERDMLKIYGCREAVMDRSVKKEPKQTQL